jgi:APA family basic amino acid/polyamine antiporter
MAKEVQKIGLITTTSLVVGNMIGSGIFVLPAALAKYGSISFLGWLFTAAGAIILALIFSKFSKIIVHKSGGPYAYSKAGFGDFIGFLVAWGYWISCWVVNAAIAVAIVSAMTIFFPVLETSSLLGVVVGLGFIWFFTWINSKGVQASGKFQVITTVLKIVPLLLIILFGIFFIDIENFSEFNISGDSNFDAFSAVATLTLFAFLGIECATVPAANVKDPEYTIPKATMLGTGITTAVYILGTVVLFGILPIEKLSMSPAPFAEAAILIGGDYFGYIVAAGAAIAAIGALNGWILIMGQMSMATAQDGLFPKIFKKENDKGVPALGLIIGSVLSSVIMLMNYTDGLVDQFEFMVLLTTLTALIPYLFTAASYGLILIDQKLNTSTSSAQVAKKKINALILSGLGFAYSLWAIYGSGEEPVFYGFLLLLMGVPFYVLGKYNNRKII